MTFTRDGSTQLFLRIGLAFSFIYPAVAAFLEPLSWIGFFPKFILVLSPISDVALLNLFGATEIIIALWILIGRNVFVPSLIAALYLAAIVLFNFLILDILFRDVSIFAMAIALAFLTHPSKAKPPSGTQRPA